MTWFRVDDDFAHHPKVTRLLAGPHSEALILWMRAGSWCAKYLTNGQICQSDVRLLCQSDGQADGQAEALVEVGLWERTGGGYQFHDWSDYQPDPKDVRVSDAARKARDRLYQRRRRLHAAGDHSLCLVGRCPQATPSDRCQTDCQTDIGLTSASNRATPSRPVPSRKGQGTGAAGTAAADPSGSPAVPEEHDLADAIHAAASAGRLTLTDARAIAGGDYATAMAAIRNDPRLTLHGDRVEAANQALDTLKRINP